MAKSRVILYDAQMFRLLEAPEGPVGKMLERRGERVKMAARAQVGVRTGALRASIHMRHLRDSRGQYVKIGSSKNYALLHHNGTRPHVISGKNKMLKFMNRGQMVFAHTVLHPGTKANKYLTDNLHLITLP